MDNEADPSEQPYMVDEFGEVTDLRPGGCPHCGEKMILVFSRSCWRCRGTFEPSQPLGN